MRFIHQQLNSFLNLGVCKEYPIMARPPKNTSSGAESPSKTRSKKFNPEALAAELPTAEIPAVAPEVKAAAPEKAPSALKPESKSFAPRNTEARKSDNGKAETRKTELRKNVFPINIEEEIRRRAYELYEQRGYSSGSEADDWLNAEREVLQRYDQHSA
jgi:hypothetical protein